MIAMALACKPDLVIADEPTTALDVTIQDQILHLFRELKEKRHMSLLYITHNLGVVAEMSCMPVSLQRSEMWSRSSGIPVIPMPWDFWLRCRAGGRKGSPFIRYRAPFQTPPTNPRGVPSIPGAPMCRKAAGSNFLRCAILEMAILRDVRLSISRGRQGDRLGMQEAFEIKEGFWRFYP
jgi:energy-coupling factor transporter ATP-binding protein EcfA2